MPGNKRLLWFVFVGVLALSQTACVVETQHPLSDPATATFDERLFGEWRMPDGSDHYAHYFIGKVRHEVENAPKGLFLVYNIRINTKERSIEAAASPLFGFTSKVGASDYFNLVELKKDPNKPYSWGNEESRKYLLAKYTVDQDRLSVWFLDLPATAKEVESGKLTGRVNYRKDKKVQSVFVSDSTEKLRSFLEKGGQKSVFIEKDKLVMNRVKW